jgi:hypothetical protein
MTFAEYERIKKMIFFNCDSKQRADRMASQLDWLYDERLRDDRARGINTPYTMTFYEYDRVRRIILANSYATPQADRLIHELSRLYDDSSGQAAVQMLVGAGIISKEEAEHIKLPHSKVMVVDPANVEFRFGNEVDWSKIQPADKCDIKGPYTFHQYSRKLKPQTLCRRLWNAIRAIGGF